MPMVGEFKVLVVHISGVKTAYLMPVRVALEEETRAGATGCGRCKANVRHFLRGGAQRLAVIGCGVGRMERGN